MGSIKLPNLSLNSKYLFFKNIMPLNSNFWNYYYFFFLLKLIFNALFLNKNLSFFSYSSLKNSFKFKNILFLGNLFIIYNKNYFIIKINYLNYYNFFNYNFKTFLNFQIIKKNIKKNSILNYKNNF